MIWRLCSALLIAMTLQSVVSAQSDACSRAMEMFRQHLWSGAAKGFGACEQQRPGQTEAPLFRGKSLVNLRDYDAAATVLRGYAASHPQSDDAAYLLAFIAFREDKPTESLQLFSKAAKLKAPSGNDLMIIALDYVLLRQYSDAAHYLELSLKANPDDVEARYHLGRVRYQQNQFDLAIAAFDEVLKRDPKDVRAEDNLGLSLEAKNQIQAAIAAYRKAIELDRASPSHSEQPYLNLGSLMARSNHFDEAIPLLTQAQQIAPSASKVRYELARAYFDSGKLEPAREQAEEAVKLNAKDSASHYLLGRVYQRLNQKDLAKEQFQLTSQLLQNKSANSSEGMASRADTR